MRQLLAPFDQTAVLCRMTYLAPFVVHGTHTLDADTGCWPAQRQYRALLARLRDGTLDLVRASAAERVNDVIGDA
jgi:glutathione-regulated potassium-efflux system ancillary protein KefG